jgi:hypothetical protein
VNRSLGLLAALLPALALADVVPRDTSACVGLQAGAPCTHRSGQAGVCAALNGQLSCRPTELGALPLAAVVALALGAAGSVLLQRRQARPA